MMKGTKISQAQMNDGMTVMLMDRNTHLIMIEMKNVKLKAISIIVLSWRVIRQ